MSEAVFTSEVAASVSPEKAGGTALEKCLRQATAMKVPERGACACYRRIWEPADRYSLLKIPPRSPPL